MHTCEWVLAHISFSHVKRMIESWQTYQWVMSRVWISHVAPMNESLHTYEWIMSQIWCLEQGNCYVVANIRGGGEFGPNWHKAALKEKRQKAYQVLPSLENGKHEIVGCMRTVCKVADICESPHRSAQYVCVSFMGMLYLDSFWMSIYTYIHAYAWTKNAYVNTYSFLNIYTCWLFLMNCISNWLHIEGLLCRCRAPHRNKGDVG